MKRTILFVTIFALLLSLLPVSAAELGKEGIYSYHIANGEATFLCADRRNDPLIIPDTLGGCPVTAIGAQAFSKNTQEPYIVIPASVKTIDNQAFTNLHIETVYILGENIAYQGSYPTAGRWYIHEDVFADWDATYYSSAFYTIHLEDYPCDPLKLTQTEEGNWCYSVWGEEAVLLSAKESGTVPATLGGKPVTYIAPFCFQKCTGAVTLPDTVKSIGSYAFRGAECTMSRLPAALERLGILAMSGCSLEASPLPKGIRRIGQYALSRVEGETLTVPGSCKYLGTRAIRSQTLKEVLFEDGVEYLGDYAVDSACLTKLTIPGTVTHCGTLSSYEDRKNLTVYGDKDSAAYLYCGETGIVFVDRTTGKRYEAPHETTVDGVKYTVYPDRYAAVTKLSIGYAQQLVIPDKVENVPVTKVTMGAFSNGTMTSLYLPDTITYMGDWGLSGCPNLSRVHLPASLQEVGDFCFADNPKLCCLVLPEGLTKIGSGAFDSSWGQILVSKSEAVLAAAQKQGGTGLRLTTDDPIVYEDHAVCKVVDGEAILIACIMTQSGGEDTRSYVVPDTVEGYPVVGVSGNTKYLGHILCYNMVLGENVRYLEDGAIRGTYVNTLYADAALESLPDDLFAAGGEIYGISGSYAQSYADAHSIPFHAMDKLPFLDVPEDKWYYPYVYMCYWSELMQGTSSTAFAPNAPTNRAMLVTVLWRMCDYQSGEFDPNFSDVVYDSWYYAAVKWASSYGVVYGVSANRFAPKQNITREQTAAILYRFSALLGADVESFAPITGFRDGNTASDYAKSALMWAVGAGILQGNANNQLNPRGNTTRAEMAAILVRYTLWLEGQA